LEAETLTGPKQVPHDIQFFEIINQKMSLMSKSTAAYIAGFTDGEGYLSIIKDDRRNNFRRNPAYTCVIKIANTNKEIIDWLHLSYGGTLHHRKMGGNSKDAYCWTLTGTKLVPFLQKIYPYLRIKKKQVDVINKYRGTVIPSSYIHIERKAKNGGRFLSKTTRPEILKLREQLYQEVRELNRRGTLHGERLSEMTPRGSDSLNIQE